MRAPYAASSAAVALWLLALLAAEWSPAALAPWAPWLLWCALSAATSDQPLMSAAFMCRWGGFAALLLLLGGRQGSWPRRAFLVGLWAVGAAVAAASLWTGGALLWRTGHSDQMTGLLPPYYNYSAFVEAAAAAAAVAAALRPPPFIGRRGTAALGSLAAALTAVLLAARARGALLALLAAVILIAASRRAWGRLAALLGAGVALAALITGIMLAANGSSPAFLLKLERSAAFTRPQIWRAALEVADDHPVLGEGPGSFEQGYLRHRFPTEFRGLRYLFTTPYAHSEPLQAAAETGWVGLALLLWALWRSRPRLSADESRPEREALAAAALAMLAHCFVDNMTQLPALGMLLLGAWTLAGTPAPERRPRTAWRAAAGAALALSLIAWLPAATVERAVAQEAPDSAARLERARAAARVAPASADVAAELARAWLSQSPPRPDKAWPQLVRARGLDPYNALYPALEGEFARAKDDWQDEERLARAALDLEPNYALARLQLAEALAHQGDRAAAASQLEEAERRRASMDPNACAAGYGAEICRLDPQRLAQVRSILTPGSGLKVKMGRAQKLRHR